MATAASPFILAFLPVRNKSIALMIVTGMTISMLFVSPTNAETAIAPKAT